MAQIRTQKIPRKEPSIEDIIAKFCYNYPQYKYHEAKQLPYKRLNQMLLIAEKERARFLYDITQIVASPHTKKGQGVKKMLEYFKGILSK